MPSSQCQMGWQMRGVRYLGDCRRVGTDRLDRGRRRAAHHCAVHSGGSDQFDRPDPDSPFPDRGHRTRPGARRRGGSRVGDPTGRRPWCRQVHAAARGGAPLGEYRQACVVCVGRRVRRTDQDAGRTHRVHPRRGLPGGRVRRPHRSRPHRCGQPQPRHRRFGPDDVRERYRRRGGRRHPGEGRDHGTDLGCQVDRRRHGAGRTRHQGRGNSGSTVPRTPGGRGPALRRRSQYRHPDGARSQEPFWRGR